MATRLLGRFIEIWYRGIGVAEPCALIKSPSSNPKAKCTTLYYCFGFSRLASAHVGVYITDSVPRLCYHQLTFTSHQSQRTISPPQNQDLSLAPQSNMQFSKIFLFATAAAIATAAPTGVLEARDEYKVSKHNGKWQKGWEDTEPSEQYICQTTGLLVCT